jgi:hypothetical protein
MAYIYQADLYCNSCGQEIIDRLTLECKAPEDPENEYSYDSDDFPKYVDAESEESDSPQHCGNHEDCLEAETLPNGRKIGALLGTCLTSYGLEYVLDCIKNDPNSEVVAFWKEQFDL